MQDGVGINHPRASEWHLHVKTIQLYTALEDLMQRPFVITPVTADTIRQLTSLQASGGVVVLPDPWPAEGWPALATAISELPHQPRLRFSVKIQQPLTDALLCGMLQCGTAVAQLTVDSLSLQSEQYADTPSPWDRLTVEKEVDVTQVEMMK